MVFAADQAAAAHVVGFWQSQPRLCVFFVGDMRTGAVLRLLQHLLHSRLGQTALGRILQLFAASGAHQPADEQNDNTCDNDGHRAAKSCADGRNHQAQTGKEFAEARQGTALLNILCAVIHALAPLLLPQTGLRTGTGLR